MIAPMVNSSYSKVWFIVSVLFHPLIINAIALFYLLHTYPQLKYGLPVTFQLAITLVVFALTGVLPLLVMLVFKKLGIITSVMLDEKDERTIPYMLISLMYLCCYFFAQKSSMPAILVLYLLVCSSIVVAVLLFNFKTKISIHMAALGSFAGLIWQAQMHAYTDDRILLSLVIAATGATASARLFMEAHNYWQLFLGWITGFGILFLLL
jgi:hypothetical protein